MRGHWTCQFEAGISAPFFIMNYDSFQTCMLGHWTCHFGAGPWPSFVLDSKLWLFPDFDDDPDGVLDCSFWCRLVIWSWAFGPASFLITNYDCFWTWMMGHWTCRWWQIIIVSGLGWWGVGLGVLKPILQLHAHWQIMFVSGLEWWSAGLVILKLGLWPSFIPNDKLWFSLKLDDGALDLSFWSWACVPASFSMTNHDCFQTWMMWPETWSFEDSHPASFVVANYHCFRTWMMRHWTCHFEARPSAHLHS